MANNTKKTTSNKNKSTNKKKSSSNPQLTALILFASSLLMFLLAVIPAGGVWGYLRHFLFGVFGFCSYIIPLFFIVISALITRNKEDKAIKRKLIEATLIMIVLTCLVHIISFNTDYTFGEGLSNAFVNAKPYGVGVFGAFLGGILLLITGSSKLASLCICLILLFVLVMIITGITLDRFLKAILKIFKKAGKITGEKIAEYGEKSNEENVSEKKEKKKRIKNPDVDLGPEPEIEEIPEVEEELPLDNYYVDIDDDINDDNDLDDAEKLMSLADLKAKERASEQKEEAVEVVEDIKEVEETEDTEEETVCVYNLPTLDCLNLPKKSNAENFEAERKRNAEKLVDTLNSFGVETRVVGISQGPSVTRYEIQPAAGVKISKITNLADDIALNLAASGVRIEAPIPNKAAVGIEIPNKNRQAVSLREVIDQPQYRDAKSKLTVALGKDITGEFVYSDLVKMPHLLIAGTTGSGKSVCLNSMIVSILYNATPEEVKLLMIDPKQVEFTVYNGIPHLLVPVVSDPRKASGALSWAVTEMLTRYKTFSENSVRDIAGYNSICESEGKKKMPQIVIFIDELSDLMMAAPNEVEDSICRLAQMARAAGMHLVIATQRPSVDVITGIIKANIPSRISLSVSSQVDSRTIIDSVGAEKLLGNGDMLYYPVGIPKPIRVQGCYLSDKEVENVVNFIKAQTQTVYDDDVMKEIEKQAANTGNKKKDVASSSSDDEDSAADEMLPKAIEVVVEAQSASTTLLQRKLKLGYARAARIVDALEQRGIIGPYEGAKPRKVLISKQQWYEMNAMAQNGADKDYSENE